MLIGCFAAISAAVAVAAGAFGAHAAPGPQEAEWLRTGGFYQLLHAIAALALMGSAKGPAIVLLAGSVLFALTLYAMALGAPQWLGAITPIGGTLLIGGWLWAGWIYFRG
ncbi:membrane protein [Sphingorhabdus sp. SMR4y]|nr:membrane protein [Sphingorhabdus sp. SMR4y]